MKQGWSKGSAALGQPLSADEPHGYYIGVTQTTRNSLKEGEGETYFLATAWHDVADFHRTWIKGHHIQKGGTLTIQHPSSAPEIRMCFACTICL